MSAIKRMFVLLVVMATGGLTGCQTLAPKSILPQVSDDTYVNKYTDEERALYDKEKPTKADLLLRKRLVDLNAGDPINIGSGNTAAHLLCNKVTGEITVHHGHISGSMGMESQVIAIYVTMPGTCDVQTKADGSPMMVTTKAFSQEAEGRLIVKTAGQIMTGFVNGTGAALVNKSGGSDCAGCVGTVVNAVSSAGAQSVSETNSSISIGACPTADCGGVFSSGQ